MNVNAGGMVIIKGDQINSGGMKIVKVYGGESEKKEKDEYKVLTEEDLKRKIEFVKPHIGTTKKLYFSVCRYMMWCKMVPERDFAAAVEILNRLYPELNLNADYMGTLYVASFRKKLEEWNPQDAPVKGVTYNKYYTVAELMGVG